MKQQLSGESIIFSSKKDASQQFEFSLPEYLPGISKIIKSTSCIEKTTTRNDGENLMCDVFVKLGIIYVSDFGGKIKSVFFDETISLAMGSFPRDENEAVVIPSAFISTTAAKPLNNRKFSFSCSCHASVIVLNEVTEQMPEENKDEGLHTLRENKSLVRKITLPEQFLEYEDDMVLDSSSPAVGEIIFADAVFCSAVCTVSDSHLDFEGKFMLHVLYETAEDKDSDSASAYTVATHPITVNGSIENEKIKSGMQAFVYLDCAKPEPSVSFDSYGENRVVSFKIGYSAMPILFEKYESEIVTDAFSEKGESTPQISGVCVCNHKFSVSDSIRITEALKTDIKDLSEVSDCVAKILSVSMEYSDSKLFAAAKCLVNVYGASRSGELSCSDSIVTLHIPIAPGNAFTSDCIPEVLLSVKNCSAEIKEGAIVADFEFLAVGVVMEKKCISIVKGLDIEKADLTANNSGEIVICYPSQNDTLWNVAKRYRKAPDSILRANNMEKDDTSSKHILIIP